MFRALVLLCVLAATTSLAADAVEKRTVTIWSDGTRMVGDLYLPAQRVEGAKLSAVIFCNGTGGTRKGPPVRLGSLFAEKGFAFLAFDYRGWGESESQLMATEPQPKPDEKGEMTIRVRALRWQMNYTDQTEDIRAAKIGTHGTDGRDGLEIRPLRTKIAAMTKRRVRRVA